MSRPGRPCTVCIDPTLSAKVDALLQAGETLRAIAEITGVNRFAISRHKRHAFPPTEAEPENLSELELSDKRLATLSEQLRQQYAAALVTADNRTALDVLKVSARIEAEMHHRIVAREQAKVDTDASDPIKAGTPSPEYMTWIKDQVHNVYLRWIEERGWIWCPCCGHIPVDPATASQQIQTYLGNCNVNADAN